MSSWHIVDSAPSNQRIVYWQLPSSERGNLSSETKLSRFSPADEILIHYGTWKKIFTCCGSMFTGRFSICLINEKKERWPKNAQCMCTKKGRARLSEKQENHPLIKKPAGLVKYIVHRSGFSADLKLFLKHLKLGCFNGRNSRFCREHSSACSWRNNQRVIGTWTSRFYPLLPENSALGRFESTSISFAFR